MSEESSKETNIAIIGMGGIGSHLLASIAPSLHRGELAKSLGKTRIHIFDSDTVGIENLMHQRFLPSDVGRLKVDAVNNSLKEFQGERLEIISYPSDLRNHDGVRTTRSSDSGAHFKILEGCAFVIVCVDSDEARRVVHSCKSPWLDLRCRGDGFIAIDHRVDSETVDSLTSNMDSASCQLEGALQSGNIQFGHLASSSHGAQWAIQMLRTLDGQGEVMLPIPMSTSITFGTLGRLSTEIEDGVRYDA